MARAASRALPSPAILWVLLFWGALFAPAILRGEVLFEGEIREVHFPFDAVALEQIAEGRAPLWTDRVFMGYPLLANVETALLYPLHLPILALGVPERMITWALALAFLMGGLFAYGCARGLGQGPPAAAACGLAYMLSGYWLNAFTSLHTIFANAWQPACLWAVGAYWRAPSGPRAAAVSGAVAMTILGGHLQNAFVGLFFLAFYAAFEWARRRRDPRAHAHAARLLAAALLGVLAASAQLLPTAELAANSARASMSYEWSTYGPTDTYRPVEQVAYLWTQLVGATPDLRYATQYWAALPLLLILLGATRLRRPEVAFGLATWALCVLLACGDLTPLHRLFYALPVPGVRMFQDPERFLFPVAGLWGALLMGWGVTALSEEGRRLRLAVGAALFALIAAGAWTAPAPEAGAEGGFPALFMFVPATAMLAVGGGSVRRWGPTAATLLLACDLLLAHRPLIRFTDAAEATGALADPGERFRDPAYRALLYRLPDSFLHNVWAPVGVANAGGYGSIPLRDYLAFTRAGAAPHPLKQVPYSTFVEQEGLLDAASVRWIVTDPLGRHVPPDDFPEAPEPALDLAARGYAKSAALGFDVYERASALPRVRWVGEDGAVSEDGLAVRYEPDAIRALLSPRGAGVLVDADARYPGWRAAVDGAPAEIEAERGFLRRVRVPAGARRVSFDYDPASVRLGWCATLWGALGGLLLAAAPRARRPAR